jgi:hypothetical protein
VVSTFCTCVNLTNIGLGTSRKSLNAGTIVVVAIDGNLSANLPIASKHVINRARCASTYLWPCADDSFSIIRVQMFSASGERDIFKLSNI